MGAFAWNIGERVRCPECARAAQRCSGVAGLAINFRLATARAGAWVRCPCPGCETWFYVPRNL